MLKEKLKMDKSGVLIIRVLIVYLVIALIIFLPTYIKNKVEKLYIITNDNIKIKYTNGRWKKIYNSKDYALKKFNLYENDEYKGKYKIMYSNKLILIDDSGNRTNTNGNYVAYRGSLKLGVYDLITDELSEVDKEYIEKALIKLNLPVTYNFNHFQRVYYDIDKDGILENVYCINNFYTDDTNEKFSILFIQNEDEIKIIDKQITDSNGIYDNKIFSIINVFDIRKDGKLELLYREDYPMDNSDDSCIILHNLSKNKQIKNFCE